MSWHVPAFAYPPLLLAQLTVQNFRNLARFEVRPSPRLTVFSGPNGCGKTSLLEAMYFAATSKSFRTTKATEMVRHGQPIASVRATFSEGSGGIARTQVAAVENGRKQLRIEGNRPDSLGEYALKSPVVCFHLEELALSAGPSAARRQLLDRTALFLSPAAMDHRHRYALALRSRQKALSTRGASARDLEAFEDLCAQYGALVTGARTDAAAALVEELGAIFSAMAPGHELHATYVPGGSADPAEAATALLQRRERDRLRGAAGFGPHRDELRLLLDGHPVRSTASQGQHRAITLALKIAELCTISRARQVVPLLLLDDLSSELDRHRTASLLRLLLATPAQIFVTTTRPELMDLPAEFEGDRKEVVMAARSTAKDGEKGADEVGMK